MLPTDAMDRYLSHCIQRGLTPATTESHRSSIRRFRRMTGTDPLEVDAAAFDAWWCRLTSKMTTRSRELSYLRGYYHWALQQGLIAKDPTADLRAGYGRMLKQRPDDDRLNDYLDWCRARNFRPRTLEAKRNAVRRFVRAVGCDPLDASREQVADWFSGLMGGPATRQAYLCHIRAYIRWAIAEDLIEVDHTLRLPLPKQPRRIPRPLAEDKLANAVRTAPPQVRAMLMLAAFAGLRSCEIAKIDRSHVMEGLLQPSLLVFDGKGGHQRMLPLHPEILKALRELPLPERGPVFPQGNGRPGPMSHISVCRLMNRHLRSLGYTETAHSLRHRFGTVLYQQTRDLRITQEMMGHRSPATTALYVAHDVARAAEAVRGLGLAG